MIDKELGELIQAEIDGQTTPEESTRLRAILAESAEARARYDELAAVCRALSAIPEVEPPPNLRDSILAAVSAGQIPGAVRMSWWERLTGAGFLPPPVRFAAVFASGLAVGLIGMLLLVDGDSLGLGGDNGSAVGTMAPGAAETSAARPARTVVPLAAGKVVWESFSTGDAAIVDLTVESSETIEIELEFTPELRPEVVLRGGTAARRLEVAANRLRVVQTGESAYRLYFPERPSDILRLHYSVRSGSETLDGDLALPPAEEN